MTPQKWTDEHRAYFKTREKECLAGTMRHDKTCLRAWVKFMGARQKTDATATREDAVAFLDSRRATPGYVREVACKLRAYYRWRLATGRSPCNPFEDLYTIPNAPVSLGDKDAADYAAYRDSLSSPATMESTRRTLAGWTEFLAMRGKSPREASFDDAAAFLGVHAKGWGAATVYKQTSSLRVFHRWLIDTDRSAGRNPWDSVKAPTPSRSIPDPLLPEEWQRIEAALVASVHASHGRWLPLALRRWALVRFAFSCGARNVELRRVCVEDLDFEGRYAHLRGKGGRKPKERIVPFGPRTAEVLRLYLQDGRPHLLRSPRGILFPSEEGKPLSPSAVASAVHTAARAAEGGRRVYPHLLRHGYATKLLEGGANIREVQELLGHASLHTTEVYLHVKPDRLRAAYDVAFGGDA